MNSRGLAKKWPYTRHRTFINDLRGAAAAWFGKKGFPVHPRMPYCLSDRSAWNRNIIRPEVAEYIKRRGEECKEQGKPFPLHKYLHHGLSSQAMAFNLVGPMIASNSYEPLKEALRAHGVEAAGEVATAVFEYEDRGVFNEYTGQPTSIDIVLESAGGKPLLFIECKLAEHAFGGCSLFTSGDCDGASPLLDLQRCYLHFIERRYWELAEKHGFFETMQDERQCVFAAHYQFFREVLFAIEKGGVFVLLHDERSPVFRQETERCTRGLLPFLTGFVPQRHRNRIVSLTVQELAAAIERSPVHNEWIGEFKLKYGLA